jgi:hypothetical protein
MNNPLVWVRSRNHLRDGEVFLKEVEGDFAEVEVLPQLRIGEKNLSHRLTDNLLELLLHMYLPTQEVLPQHQFFLLFQLLSCYQLLHSILSWTGYQAVCCHILSSQPTEHCHQVCFTG